MDFRKLLQRPLKRSKDRPTGGGRKRDERSGGEDGRGADVKRGGASQMDSPPHPEVSVEGVVESGHGQEGSTVDDMKAALVDVDPPVSTPSISHIGGPDSM